jgi:Trypsin
VQNISKIQLTNHKPIVRGQMKVRFGDWDAKQESEPFVKIEIDVEAVMIHPKFNVANLQNDIAIIRLVSPVPLGLNPTISNICLPSAPIQSGIRCWTSGIKSVFFL